jgi:low affinity Fe/Cu permease
VKKNGKPDSRPDTHPPASVSTASSGRIHDSLERFSHRVTQWTGSTWAFVVAGLFVIVWAATGPFFDFSPEWQLIINTGTTIATFLMVFLIQRAQNKESRAVQLKLNEIVAAMDGASNRLVGVEELSEGELSRFHDRYLELAERFHRTGATTEACSVEESELRRRPSPASSG